MDEIKDQIDAMLNIGQEVEGSETEELEVGDPPVEEPTEKPTEEPPVIDPEPPTAEEPPVEKPSAEEPPEPSEPKSDEEPPVKESELEKIKKENESLRGQVEKLHEKKGPEPESVPLAAPEEAPVEEVDFIGEDTDLDDLTRNTGSLNKLLNKVFKAGVESARGFQESTVKNIPDIVKSNMVLQTTIKRSVDDFYKDNKDLEPFKKVVATVYEEVAAENPDWTVDKVFEEVEKETRQRLELYKKATEEKKPTEEEPSTSKNPRFAKTKSSRRSQPKPNTSHLLSEIDEMNESL